MVQQSNPNSRNSRSRAEKLSVLESLLGPEALRKLASNQRSINQTNSSEAAAVDPQRMEWHRNRLLERFREKTKSAARKPGHEDRNEARESSGTLSAGPRDIERRLSHMAELSELSREHPAVIASILTTKSRAERVAMLKTLPGPVARSVVQRLR